MTTEPSKVSEGLRQLRLLHGYTLSEFARKIGWEKSRLSQIERGRRRLTTETMEVFAKALEMTSTEIVFFAENCASPKSALRMAKRRDGVIRKKTIKLLELLAERNQ